MGLSQDITVVVWLSFKKLWTILPILTALEMLFLFILEALFIRGLPQGDDEVYS